MGVWETAAMVGKGALKVGADVARYVGERMEEDREKYEKYKIEMSNKSDLALERELKVATGANSMRAQALIKELKSRGYTSEDFARIRGKV